MPRVTPLTPDQERARKLRLLAKAPTRDCECGCGEQIPSRHLNGTERRFVAGHQTRGRRQDPTTPTTKISPRGYVLEYAPDHPDAQGRGWVRQHRLIWERANGHPGDRVIHHINGDRTDNRIENLEAMTAGEHSALHRRLEQDAQLAH